MNTEDSVLSEKNLNLNRNLKNVKRSNILFKHLIILLLYSTHGSTQVLPSKSEVGGLIWVTRMWEKIACRRALGTYPRTYSSGGRLREDELSF